MMALFTSLAAVLFLISCAADAQSEVSSGCDRYAQCASPIERVFLQYFNPNLFAQLSDPTHINLFCSLNVEAKRCMRVRLEDPCTERHRLLYIDGLMNVTNNYICTQRGRSEIVSAVGRQCGGDRNTLISALGHFQQCVDTYNTTMHRSSVRVICPSLNTLGQCLVTSLRQACGRDLGNVFRNVWRHTAPAAYELFQCGQAPVPFLPQ